MTNYKRILIAAVGALALFVLPGAAQARDRNDKCFQRIRKEEVKLERDIQKHGYFSRQADNRREKIARLRTSCGREFLFRRDDRVFRERNRRERERELREERRERRDRRDRNRDRDRDEDRK